MLAGLKVQRVQKGSKEASRDALAVRTPPSS